MDLARRVSNTRSYGQRLARKGIEPRTIWATPKAKRNRFFERYEKEFLAEPQPLRADAPSRKSRRTAAAFEPYTQCKFQASDERSA